ncbi:MAG: OmpH family outer membrane protein [Nitrospiraceae bacterium]|nr:OmpH family outer membrane protein [Nitrospiraceae bacterium]
MKKIFLLILIAGMLFAVSALAADKIGFINIQRVVLESEAGKKAKIDLETLEKSKKSILDEKLKAMGKIEDELKKQSSVLSADAKKSKEEELERMKRDIQRLVADIREELQKKEAELTESILKEAVEIIDAFGKENDYSMIVRSEVVIHAKKDIDLTDIIINKLNESKGMKSETKEKTKSKSKSKK